MAQRSAIEKADQVAHRFFLKFALIVDNARETVEPLAHESATARNDKWFNIETPDSEKYSEQLRAYRYISKLQSPPPPFEIQVLLTIPELRNNQVLVFNVSPTSRVRMDPTISHIVLESWQLEFTPSSVGDDIRLAAVYKQGITLYRSLFSLLRVLPAWRLCQKLRRRRTKHGLIPNGSLGIEIRVRTDTGVLRIDTPISTSSPPPRTSTRIFAPIPFPLGTITLGVKYLSAPHFRLESLESYLSSEFLSLDAGAEPTPTQSHSLESMPVTLSTSFEHSSSPRSLPILTNPARQLRKVPTAFTERFALPAPGTAPKSNRHITYANVVNSQSRKVEPLEHRWPDPTSNFQRKRSVTGHVYASEGPSSSLLQEVTGKNLSMVSTDYRQESCHNGRGLEFATAWSFDASPVQSVSAEITDEWQVWWQENTREMAAFLDRHRDRDINVERQKECVTLARSAQIYQRLVVYFYLEMHVFGPHGTMDFLHETLMKWAEWDELQWLANHHVVRSTLWEHLDVAGTAVNFCNLRGILKFDMGVICTKLIHVLNDRQTKKRFLALCQSDPIPALDLLQSALDQDNLSSKSRSLLARALVRLAKTSRSYPDCITLTEIERSGINPVAGGGFADVWKGEFDKRTVALKAFRIYGKSVQERALKDFSHEAVMWRQLKHPNILPFYGVFKGDEHFDRLCLVSPWMDAGNVIDYLNLHPDADRPSLLSDVAQGLEYLHRFDPPIIHGDLKGANIFVTPSLTACLGDFGLTRFRESQESTLGGTTRNSTGTLRWQAPELLNIIDDGDTIRRSEKCDVYSFGCVCLELMTGKPPFVEIRRDPAVMRAILDRQIPQRPLENLLDRGLDDKLWTFMQQCWNFDPDLRPDTVQLVEYFKRHQRAERLTTDTDNDAYRRLQASLGRYGFPDHYVSLLSDYTIETLIQSMVAARPPPSTETSGATETIWASLLGPVKPNRLS